MPIRRLVQRKSRCLRGLRARPEPLLIRSHKPARRGRRDAPRSACQSQRKNPGWRLRGKLLPRGQNLRKRRKNRDKRKSVLNRSSAENHAGSLRKSPIAESSQLTMWRSLWRTPFLFACNFMAAEKTRPHSTARIRIATRLRTQRAGRFSPVMTSCSGPVSVSGLLSRESATMTVPSCTSGVTSPIEQTT